MCFYRPVSHHFPFTVSFVDLEKDAWAEDESEEDEVNANSSKTNAEIMTKKSRLGQLIAQRFQAVKGGASAGGIGGSNVTMQRSKQGRVLSKKASNRMAERQQILDRRSWKRDKCTVIVAK